MNHIIAALFVIGILFSIWAGLDNAAEIADVRGPLAEISATVEDLPDAGDPALAPALTSIAGALAVLENEVGLFDEDSDSPEDGARLPADLKNRLASFRTEVENLQEAERTAPVRDRAELIATWNSMRPSAAVSQSHLAAASLTVQARILFSKLTGGAELAVSICIGFISIMALWLGLMRLADEAGLVSLLARVLNPVLRLLFPSVPRDHPANGAMVMNIAANVLGLDNAATPIGLKAMKELQTLNTSEDTITDAQAMFLAINTSSVNLIPFTVIAYRVTEGSKMPNDIILPTILATTCSTLTAILVVTALRRTSPDPGMGPEDAIRVTHERLRALAVDANAGKEAK